MSTLKIPCEQWGSYLSSSLSGEALEVFIHEISEEQLCNFDDVIVVISQGIGQMPKFATSEWWTMTKRQGQDSSSGTRGGNGYKKELQAPAEQYGLIQALDR